MMVKGTLEAFCPNPRCWASLNMYWKWCPFCGSEAKNDVVRSDDPREGTRPDTRLDSVREETNGATPPTDESERGSDPGSGG